MTGSDTKVSRRRRKGVAVLCALAASAITIPVVDVAAHGGDTCTGGLTATLIQIGDCESGGDSGSAPAAPAQQQQQQQAAGGGGGGGASSSASSSASGAAGSGD